MFLKFSRHVCKIQRLPASIWDVPHFRQSVSSKFRRELQMLMKYRRMILKISIKKHFRYVAQRHERLQLLSIHYLVVQKRVNLVDLENAENSLK